MTLDTLPWLLSLLVGLCLERCLRQRGEIAMSAVPVRPGFYWAHHHSCDTWEVVWLLSSGTVLQPGLAGRLSVSEAALLFDDWQGPLQPEPLSRCEAGALPAPSRPSGEGARPWA